MVEGSSRSYINDASVGKALSTYVKSERDKAKLSNQEICKRLELRFGVVQTPDNLKNKINRGNFGAQLLIMIMSVLEVDKIDINVINRLYESVKTDEL